MATSVCRVCLVDNMNLYSVHNDLQNVYERIARLKYNKVGYPVHMCYICLTVLRKCQKFMQTARDTNNVLKQWRKQQNEMREARPLYTYTMSKADFVPMYNENMTFHIDVKVENIESEQEVQRECNVDVVIEKIDMDDQTDNSELLVDGPNHNTYVDTVETNNDRQTDPICDYTIACEETSSFASNLDDHTHIEQPTNMVPSQDNECNVDVVIEKIDMDEHTDNSELLVDGPNDNTYADTVEDNDERQIDSLFNIGMDFEEISSSSSNLDNHDATIKIISSHDNECNTDMNKENTNADEQADYNELLVSTDTDTVEDNNDTQTEPLFVDREDYKEINANIGSRTKLITPHDNDAPPIKKSKTDDTKPQHQAPEASGEIAANGITSLISTPSQPDNIDNRNTKTNPTFGTFGKNNRDSEETGKLVKIVKTKVIRYKSKILTRNIIKNSKKSNKLALNGSVLAKNKINTCNYKTTVQHVTRETTNYTDEKRCKCDICDFQSNKQCDLANHMRIHTSEKPFFCDICVYKCTRKTHLVQHMKTHTGEKPFSCDICAYKSARKGNLATHMKTHNRENSFSCDICVYKFIKKCDLVKHMRTHTGEKRFTCNTCDYKCIQKGNLERHMRKHTGEKTFTCNTCNYKCKEKCNLIKHIRTHTGEKTFTCNTCDYKCIQKSNLTRHMKKHTVEKPFSCTTCNYKCKDKGQLVQHLRTHTGEKKFACNTCNYKCRLKGNLVRHMRTHTEDKPFTCTTCNYKCVEKGNLVRHMRTHAGEKQFTCNICNYKCIEKGYLVHHMRTHTGEKFTCNTCNYKYIRKCDLVIHMRTHTGEKPFSCDICVYKCTRKSNLVTHMRTHTGEKPFTCYTCHYKCTDKSGLVRHMRTHTDEKPYLCTFCNYKCIRKDYLESHLKIHTPFICDICDYKCSDNGSLKRHLINKHVNKKRK